MCSVTKSEIAAAYQQPITKQRLLLTRLEDRNNLKLDSKKMKNSLGKLLVSTSMAIGLGAVAATSAQAGTLTSPTIGGTAASDYLVYGVSGNNTVKINNPTAQDLKNALTGNAASPTGNVELRASSEQGSFNAFEFKKNTTLSGQIGGKSLTLSSLTSDDWFGVGNATTTYGANNFANTWFNQFLDKAGKSNAPNLLKNAAFNQFLILKGFQRSSDPNISYVNQDDTTGLIKIGLAGHYDLKAAYTNSPFSQFTNSLPNGFQASEVVKYSYNGVTDYKYSFNATRSNIADIADGKSHNGNYEVTIQGVPPTKVPEPSVMLGVLGVAGIVAAQRKLKKVSA